MIFIFIKESWQNVKKQIDIRMISEESGDTEDWINDAENSAFHHRNTKVISPVKLWFTVNL